MGLLKDWMARWRFRLPERPAAEPGSVFITMDEKKYTGGCTHGQCNAESV